jgi:cell wall-associated NlpC family hydrolase
MKRLLYILAGVMISAVALAAGPLSSAVPASAATVPGHLTAYRFARDQIGIPYVYGGESRGGYDCSGLVQAAYRAAGITIPRTTEEMLADGRQLIPETHAQAHWGDLVFFGSGHVELYAGGTETLGALETGTLVGYHRWYPGSWWVPTAYFRVRGAGG